MEKQSGENFENTYVKYKSLYASDILYDDVIRYDTYPWRSYSCKVQSVTKSLGYLCTLMIAVLVRIPGFV